MARRLFALLALPLAACSTGRAPDGPAPSADVAALANVWAGLDGAAAALSGREPDVCGGAFGTWFTDFGVRGLACLAAQAESPGAVLGRAPVAPFHRGPHTASAAAVRLDLDAPRAFGHYDPAFVRWLVGAGVPDADDAAVVALTKPVYDRRLARLARVYWLTRRDLERGGFPAKAPPGPAAQYAAFLDGAAVPAGAEGRDADGTPNGGFSVFAFTPTSERLLPDVGLPVENEWTVTYEANTAYGFWLRRRADGTEGLWHDGLRRLLRTYDAGWLARTGG